MPLWFRLIAIILVIALILWLPIEDVGVRNVVIFALAINAWWAARALLRLSPSERSFIIRHMIITTLAGAGVSPMAVLLMVFKTGLHAHGAPDYTLSQMQSILARTPAWALAGFLLGLGIAIARLNLPSRPEQSRR